MPVVSFYTSWKHQNAIGFLLVSGGLERDQWNKMGLKRKKKVEKVETKKKSILKKRKKERQIKLFWIEGILILW